jgi:hypothetical protein
LSGKQNGESSNGAAGHKKNEKRMRSGEKKPRKPRGSEIGRALRSIYDDTLREAVPDDFKDLLGKLS